jgi:RarD protein
MTPPDARGDAEIRTGVVLGLLAYTMWGVFPVYFKWIAAAAPLEVLSHRVVWAVVFGALIITLRSQWREVRGAFVDRSRLAWLALAALSISLNWLIYIWAVQNERIFETSLGYYINPLMYVAVGIALFGERLRKLQVAAVAFAVTGVLILTLSGGVFPWVALSLAALFTAYGVIRKRVPIGAMPGLFVETLVVAARPGRSDHRHAIAAFCHRGATAATDHDRIHAVSRADPAVLHRSLLRRGADDGPHRLFLVYLGSRSHLQLRRTAGIKKAPAGRAGRGLISDCARKPRVSLRRGVPALP